MWAAKKYHQPTGNTQKILDHIERNCCQTYDTWYYRSNLWNMTTILHSFSVSMNLPLGMKVLDKHMTRFTQTRKHRKCKHGILTWHILNGKECGNGTYYIKIYILSNGNGKNSPQPWIAIIYPENVHTFPEQPSFISFKYTLLTPIYVSLLWWIPQLQNPMKNTSIVLFCCPCAYSQVG